MKTERNLAKTTRKAVFKLGCAGALFQAMNSMNEQTMPEEEKATYPFCGGLMQEGLQCGMLWGAALGAGTETYNITRDVHAATALTIDRTSSLLNSFHARTGHTNCMEITRCDHKKPLGMAKFLLTGKPLTCARLAGKWAIDIKQHDDKQHVTVPATMHITNCAAETARQLGATEKEQVMVSGLSGGLGLKGGACGALGTALYLITLKKVRSGENTDSNPEAEDLLKSFKNINKGNLKCKAICGKEFGNLEEHAEFIEQGGCKDIIDFLVGQYKKHES